MYYRNANCAVVVYDITQAVRAPITFSAIRLLGKTNSGNLQTVIAGQGKVMGEGAAATGE
jgi:hypothetical protein